MKRYAICICNHNSYKNSLIQDKIYEIYETLPSYNKTLVDYDKMPIIEHKVKNECGDLCWYVEGIYLKEITRKLKLERILRYE
jgi:allophanate hydrolase subunit 1